MNSLMFVIYGMIDVSVAEIDPSNWGYQVCDEYRGEDWVDVSTAAGYPIKARIPLGETIFSPAYSADSVCEGHTLRSTCGFLFAYDRSDDTYPIGFIETCESTTNISGTDYTYSDEKWNWLPNADLSDGYVIREPSWYEIDVMNTYVMDEVYALANEGVVNRVSLFDIDENVDLYELAAYRSLSYIDNYKYWRLVFSDRSFGRWHGYMGRHDRHRVGGPGWWVIMVYLDDGDENPSTFYCYEDNNSNYLGMHAQGYCGSTSPETAVVGPSGRAEVWNLSNVDETFEIDLYFQEVTGYTLILGDTMVDNQYPDPIHNIHPGSDVLYDVRYDPQVEYAVSISADRIDNIHMNSDDIRINGYINPVGSRGGVSIFDLYDIDSFLDQANIQFRNQTSTWMQFQNPANMQVQNPATMQLQKKTWLRNQANTYFQNQAILRYQQNILQQFWVP